MNKHIVLLFIVLIFISGCNNSKKADKAVICGSIENNEEQFIILCNGDLSDTIFFNSGNKFKKSIQLNNPEYLYLRYVNEIITVYIKPGDSILVTGMADNFTESLKFSGSSQAENNYLIEKKKHDKKSEVSLSAMTQSEVGLYIKKADSVYQSDLQFLDKNLKKYNADNLEFYNIEKAKLFYTWAENLVTYENANSTGPDNNNTNPDKNIRKYMEVVSFNDSFMIEFSEYKIFFESYLNMKAGLLTKDFEAKADMDYFTNKINLLLQTTTNQKVKNRLLYDYLKNHINLFGITGLNELYMKFLKECTNKKYAYEINKMYNHWKKIEPGNIAPDFKLSDLNDNVHALNEFKGKMVYIDVWATWCAPCRREIPFVQKLYNEYKRKEIVFISISIDESKDAWKKMLEYEKPEWMQLHMEKDKSTFLEDYLISTIPRFILIGKDGKIIDAQAPAASGDIRKLLDKEKPVS